MNAGSADIPQPVVRRRLANVLGRAQLVIVAIDGPIARFEAALDAEAFGRRALEYLRAADGPYPFLLNFNIFGPLAILNYAQTRGAEHAQVVEGFLRDAELAAAERTELVEGAGDVLDACRATGRTAVVAGRVDRDAMDVVLGRHGLTGRADAILARAKSSAITSFEALAARFGTRPERAVMVGDEMSVLSEAQDGGVMPIGVATRRCRRKQLTFSGDEFSAVVSNMTSLAAAMRACPPIAETSR